MSSTFNELTERVDTLLHGYSLNTESTTWLTISATAASTTLTVYDAGNVGRGNIQIGDEIIYVNNTNNVDNTLTISPWGRAQRGTTAAAYAINEKVTVSPMFPRNEIKKAINDTINSIGSNIFAVGQTEFTYVAAKTTYDIDDSAEDILSVTHSLIGPSKEWYPVRAYQFDRAANPTAFGTGGNLGKSISVYSSIMPGRTVSVVYSKRPTLFTAGAQDFVTQTGLPSFAEDVIIYGAAFRMVSFLDPSRLGPMSAEADVVDQQRGAGAGTAAARFLFNVYQTRLNEVANELKRLYPVRSHYQR